MADKYPDPLLRRDSYTALRLFHAVPRDMHLESRVLLIGPIPHDWLVANTKMYGSWDALRKLLPTRAYSKYMASGDALEHPRTVVATVNNDVLNHVGFDEHGTAGETTTDDSDDETSVRNAYHGPNAGGTQSGFGVLVDNEQSPHLSTSRLLSSDEGDDDDNNNNDVESIEAVTALTQPREPTESSVPMPIPDTRRVTDARGASSVTVSDGSRSQQQSFTTAESFMTAQESVESSSVSMVTPLATPPPPPAAPSVGASGARMSSESLTETVTRTGNGETSSLMTVVPGQTCEDVDILRSPIVSHPGLGTSSGSASNVLRGILSRDKREKQRRLPPKEVINEPLHRQSQEQQNLYATGSGDLGAPFEPASDNNKSLSRFDAQAASEMPPQQVLPRRRTNQSQGGPPQWRQSFQSGVTSQDTSLIDLSEPDHGVAAAVRFAQQTQSSRDFDPVALTEDDMTLRKRSTSRRISRVVNMGGRNIHLRTRMRKYLKVKNRGEVLMVDRMLVMVKSTLEAIPDKFYELEACDTKVMQRWTEYVVVARNTGNPDKPVLLEFYTTRKIKKLQRDRRRRISRWDVKLSSSFRVNLYSSLDKSIALYPHTSSPSKKPNNIYILCARSVFSAMTWMTFFASVLGYEHDRLVQVRIPEFKLTVDIDLPPSRLRELVSGKRPPLVPYSEIKDLHTTPSRVATFVMGEVLKSVSHTDAVREYIERNWRGKYKVGLAWRRYDRLQWVLDLHESQVQVAWSMIETHDLEMRPKLSATRTVHFDEPGRFDEEMDEPAPVEGFVERLSTWTGGQRKQSINRRAYLHSHDNLLFYSQTDKVLPPVYHDVTQADIKNKTAGEILQGKYNSYEVAPFKVIQGRDGDDIEWILAAKTLRDIDEHDQRAQYEWERRTANIALATGFVDMTEITEINPINEYRDTPSDAHRTKFELLFIGGRRIVFQAVSSVARDIWVHRLTKLRSYWEQRLREEGRRMREFRDFNLEKLRIDEETEALVEKSAKWESDRGIPNSYMYTVNVVSLSRSILLKGELFQKPIKYSSFRKCYALLTHAHLHIFSPFTRSFSGALEPRVNYHRVQTINLRDCYAISGPVTASELLERDLSFDIDDPGSHALPRLYPDGWRSSEEEIFRCFVLWFGLKKPIRTINPDGKKVLTSGRRLGSRGYSMVFLTRSRQERDQWVTHVNHVISSLAPHYDDSINLE